MNDNFKRMNERYEREDTRTLIIYGVAALAIGLVFAASVAILVPVHTWGVM